MATKGPDQLRLPKVYPATVEEIHVAQRDAERAAEMGQGPGSNSYRAGSDEREVFLRGIWARAYRHRQAELREERLSR